LPVGSFGAIEHSSNILNQHQFLSGTALATAVIEIAAADIAGRHRDRQETE